jgi:DNA mismatch repair protein MSH3
MKRQTSISQHAKKPKISRDSEHSCRKAVVEPFHLRSCAYQEQRPTKSSLRRQSYRERSLRDAAAISVSNEHAEHVKNEDWEEDEEIMSSFEDWTPLERQFMDIKSEHPGVLLMIECGYRYRFFGEDAETVAKELGIVSHQSHHFMTASVPIYRLSVQLQRLVQAGHKVGLVQQTETAALRAIDKKKYGPFQRQLTHIYTKSTWVDGIDDVPMETMHNNMLVAIKEQSIRLGSDDKIHCFIAAVQLSTGEVYLDDFDDRLLRSELETRLVFLQPVEILVDKYTGSLTQHFLQDWRNSRGNLIRIEESDPILDNQKAFQVTLDFYKNSESSSQMATVLNSLDDGLIHVLYMLLCYLQSFHMEEILKMSLTLQRLTLSNHMRLTGQTLNVLEVFENQANLKKEGSLWCMMDHCATPFGRRLLHKWLGFPLVDMR